MGLLPKDHHPKNVKEDTASFLFMCDTNEDCIKWKEALLFIQRQNMLLNHGDELISAFAPEDKTNLPTYNLSTILEAIGEVREISITIYGKPPTMKLPDYESISKSDDEVPLVIFREEHGKSRLKYSTDGLKAELAVKKYEIQDVLKKTITGKLSYIAVSQCILYF